MIDRSFKVFFALGSAQISPRSRVVLDELLRFVEDEHSGIIARGHVDRWESRRFADLDLHRAISVRDYLTSHGMVPDHFAVSVTTSGDREPGAPTPPGQAEPYNRYVDFYLTGGNQTYLEARQRCAAWIDRSCIGTGAKASDAACHTATTFLSK